MDDTSKRDTEDNRLLSAVEALAQTIRIIAARKDMGRAPQPEPSGGKVMNISRERAS